MTMNLTNVPSELGYPQHPEYDAFAARVALVRLYKEFVKGVDDFSCTEFAHFILQLYQETKSSGEEDDDACNYDEDSQDMED
jgi:hypothetical protein